MAKIELKIIRIKRGASGLSGEIYYLKIRANENRPDYVGFRIKRGTDKARTTVFLKKLML